MTTSLSTSKTPGIIVSEIKMMRSFKGVHFLIEGAHDIKFWKLHLKCENVNFVDCGGRKNLIGAVLKIEQAAIPAVAGVYDPDFDRLHGTAPRSPNILVPTDSNDLEITLLRSDALNRLLAIYVDAALLASFESSSGVTVAAHIERTSREFGRLRFLNDVVKHCVDFDELSPYRFMSSVDWSLNLANLNAEYSKLASLADLDAALLAHCPSAPPWAYSQGHDALKILTQGLRFILGKRQMSEEDVMRLLLLAYTETMLKQTSMYTSLRIIETRLPMQLFP